MHDAELLEAIGAGGAHPGAGRFVETDGDVQFLTGRPERVIIPVVPRPIVEDVGSEEDRLHPELPHRASRLRHRARHVVGRDGGGAEETLGVGGLDVVVQPVVVGAARGVREARVHGLEGRDVHGRRGEEDREVEALLVHGPNLRFGIEVARDLFGVAITQRLLFDVGERRPVTAGHGRHDLAFHHRADVPTALVQPPGRAGLELGVDVAVPEVHGLHHVHLGVDHLETVLGHGSLSHRPPLGPAQAR